MKPWIAIVLLTLSGVAGAAAAADTRQVPRTPEKPATFLESKPAPARGPLVVWDVSGNKVAQCEPVEGQDDNKFASCKMEPGYTLDDLMNAWVHAYLNKD